MGIGSVIKDVLRSDSRTGTTPGAHRKSNSIGDGSTLAAAGISITNEAAKYNNSAAQRSSGGSYDLPSGTGPGTTGVPGTGQEDDALAGAAAPAGKVVRRTENVSDGPIDETPHTAPGVGQRDGQLDASSRNIMPSGHIIEDHLQLNPVTHEHVRHLETEEVQRVKDRDRHIHHVQHHVQPVVTSEELEEKQHANVYPVTKIREHHANKSEHTTLLENQIHQHHDSVQHGAKERVIIDKGTIVNENTHHHVHHVIQPVIAKETIDRHRIHTTIPIREEIHEAPVIHQSQDHIPVSIDQYLEHGGLLSGATQVGDTSKKLLHTGERVRQVDGVAERLEKDLNLASNTTGSGVDVAGPHGQNRDDNLL